MLSWQWKIPSVRPPSDSQGLGPCVSGQLYYIAIVQQSTAFLILVLGNTDKEKKSVTALWSYLLKAPSTGVKQKRCSWKARSGLMRSSQSLFASLLGGSHVEMARTGVRWGEETQPVCFGHKNQLGMRVRDEQESESERNMHHQLGRGNYYWKVLMH